MNDVTEKYHGMWDFEGACAPPENGSRKVIYATFSLGCFQWLKKASKPGFKKSSVRHRIKGDTSDPSKAYAAAREYCKQKNNAGS